MAYVKHRFISKSGRMIPDILEIANTFALAGFLAIVDIGKSFDSINHCFLLQFSKNSNWYIFCWLN